MSNIIGIRSAALSNRPWGCHPLEISAVKITVQAINSCLVLLCETVPGGVKDSLKNPRPPPATRVTFFLPGDDTGGKIHEALTPLIELRIRWRILAEKALLMRLPHLSFPPLPLPRSSSACYGILGARGITKQ